MPPRSAVRVGVRVLLTVVVAGLLAVPSRGQWIEPPGTGWVKLQVAHQDTRERFDENGTVESYFNEDARSITTTVRLSGAVGLWRGLDAWVDVPYHRLAFNDVTRERVTTGIADPRFFLRAGPSLVGVDDLPVAVALRGGVKFPVGDFQISAEQISLSQGQRDWELLLEVGKSLHPWPVYVMGWAGYRWRETNTDIERKPGDERLLYLAAGGSIDRLRWKLALDGQFGRPPVRRDFGNIELERDRRELLQLIPTLGWAVGPGAIEAGVRLPLHGRNLPAGPVLTLGYFLSWDEPLWK
jgi:hypothetical protein